MIHSFDNELAKKIGVKGAVIYRQLEILIEENGENKNGNVWVKASISSIENICPYFSKKIIDRELKRLESSGLIKSNNLNENKLDRALWYCICK